jgi:hypothetical protein
MRSGFRPQFFHDALHQLFRIRQILHDELDIHDRFARPALALAVNGMLADECHGVSDQVHGYGKASARNSHSHFKVFEFFLLLVEDGHPVIVIAR